MFSHVAVSCQVVFTLLDTKMYYRQYTWKIGR